MKWWQTGLLVGCLTMLIAFCSALAMGTAWYVGAVDFARWFENTSAEVAGTNKAQEADNRLVVLGTDGNLFTVSSSGDNRVQLTDDASALTVYSYPTWSPDGSMIAFVEVIRENSNMESALHVVSAGGELLQQVPTEFPAFYLYWNPLSERLAFLSNWESSMALRMLDVSAKAEEAVTVLEGMPFFFSWQPTGDRMLAHIGGDLLTFLQPSGEQEPLDVATGPFQAPHWSHDGQKLAFVSQGDKNQYILNVSNAQGQEVVTLAGRQGAFSFNWSPDNEHIAYSYTERNVGLAAFGPLWVHDTETHQAWELSKSPVVAFFWSPDGKRLAFLRPEWHEPVKRAPEAAPLRQETQPWLRWHIWDGEKTYPLTLFVPTEAFLSNYLRYFDQYAQSISLWSADSQMLLYAGLSEGGLSGIWVLPVEYGSQAQLIASGVLAGWSPR